MLRALVLSALVLFPTLLACSGPHPPLRTAKNLDLSRYMGRWHAVESFPERFQRGCSCIRADYDLRDDGQVRVLNACFRDGKWDRVEGVVRRKQPDDPTRLEVSFLWPFWGDYHILALEGASDGGYRAALVGTPDRDSLWLLSRTLELDETTRRELREAARQRGFDIRRLERVPRDCPR